MPQEPLKPANIGRAIEAATHNGGLAVCIKPTEDAIRQTNEENPIMQKRAAADFSPLGLAISEIREHLSKTTRKTIGKTSLTSAKRSPCLDDTGSTKCDVCGNVLSYGDVFYAIDLSKFGYHKNTEKVCAFCKDSICDEVVG